MIIENQEEQINYLVKMKGKNQCSELKRKKEFVREFNKESKNKIQNGLQK